MKQRNWQVSMLGVYAPVPIMMTCHLRWWEVQVVQGSLHNTSLQGHMLCDKCTLIHGIATALRAGMLLLEGQEEFSLYEEQLNDSVNFGGLHQSTRAQVRVLS
jgi:hypothetical protein